MSFSIKFGNQVAGPPESSQPVARRAAPEPTRVGAKPADGLAGDDLRGQDWRVAGDGVAPTAVYANSLPGTNGVPIPPPPTLPPYVQPPPPPPPPAPPWKPPVWVVPTSGGAIIKARGKHDLGGG
jgi:hypothetical protein